MFTNINERTLPLFMFVHLTKRTTFLVRVRLFNKRTNTNEPPAERFTNCSPNVWFICSPSFHFVTHLVLSFFQNYKDGPGGLHFVTHIVHNLDMLKPLELLVGD
ncbi:hypothetical protein Hanom_Chr17g01547501 [Helianthus anomalus]